MKRWMTIAVLALMLGGCNWLYDMGSNNEATDPAFDISEAGLTVPDFEYVNQEGDPFGTEQLKGNYWLVNMIFTHCPGVCNIMTPNMVNLQDAMIEEELDVKVVSFTVDPDRDTPELLKVYGENVGADFEYWSFVTGYSDEEITELAKTAFASIVQEDPENEDIIHTTDFFLVDDQGLVIRRYDGMATDQAEIINDLKATVE
ncbi:SCO family protein [Halalkalibacterium halodurans]|uniref:SCO family protein n=1 Tax=Halalkalibacterium halodurans TaxID=86665 RepID=UPI002AA9AADE|nr:SCO family protein [Halalkalibacterium halodurans]MDY7223456.1 SCO family protein [Halalkalibacterium halodurans]MDY7242677.1 SCO family protein [Halalkalibacterium halodurans]MED4081616.1 SCO family protein [Halalkalibacterium halodurans]MED4084972.1 SCO family protein [Halalkalibacterium halodurans]MED4104141.1 SCO family protein [Halalkalibacterium halodurans]